MSVSRGVTRWLAVFCLSGLTASICGCSQEVNVTTGDKPSANKTDPTDLKSTAGTIPPAKGDQGSNPNVAQNSSKKSTNGDTTTPKAKISAKPKSDVKDPPTVNKGESGSGTKRKLRGPKLGAGT